MSEAGSGIPEGPEPIGRTRTFGERLLGALKLDATVFEEVEHDPGALGQAATVVFLASVAQALAVYSGGGLVGALGQLVAHFVGWFFSVGLVWLIGVALYSYTSDYPELLRALGFASAPGILIALAVLPLGPFFVVLQLAIIVLSLTAWVIAARQALDVGTWRAAWVCLLAVLVPYAVAAVLLLVLGAAGYSARVPGGVMP